jgi:predicted dehydrogenase
MAKPVVLVVGLKNQGRAHVPAFMRDERVQVAICDLDPKQVKDVGNIARIPDRYRFSGGTAYGAALDALSPLVVALATPTVTHRALCRQGAAAGAHIFCEKPLAPNAEEGRLLLDEVQAFGRDLWVGFHMRYMHGAVTTALANGAMGGISSVELEWERLLGRPPLGPLGFPGGPIVSDLGSHQIDLAFRWLGHPPVRYTAGMDAKPVRGSELYDRYGGLIVCSSRQTVSLNMSYESAIPIAERASLRVIGDEGKLLVPLMTAREDDPGLFLPTLNGEAFGVSLDGAVLGRATPPRNPMGCFIAQATDVITAALGGDAPTLCTGEDALRVVEVVDGLSESARTLMPVMFQAP